MRLDAKVTKLFFDQKAVINAVGKSRVRSLSKLGYQVQQEAKQSLVYKPPVRKPRLSKVPNRRIAQIKDWQKKKKASASPPGHVPFVRRRQYPNLRSIVYAYDPSSQGVIVGPIERRNRSMSRPAPDIHQKGGTVQIRVKTKKGHKTVRATYPKRQFMEPALERVARRPPDYLRNSVRP